MVNSFLLKNIEKILSKTRSLQKRLKSRPQQFQFQQGVSGLLLHSPHPIHFVAPSKKVIFIVSKPTIMNGRVMEQTLISHILPANVYLKTLNNSTRPIARKKAASPVLPNISQQSKRSITRKSKRENLYTLLDEGSFHFINNFPLLAYYPPNIFLLSTPLTLKHQEKEKRKYRRYRGHWRSGLYKKLYKTMQRIARNFFRTVL